MARSCSRDLPFGSDIDFQTGQVLHPDWSNQVPSDANVVAWQKRSGADASAELAPNPIGEDDQSTRIPRLVGQAGSCVFVAEYKVPFESVQAGQAFARLDEVNQRHNLYWGFTDKSHPFWFMTRDGAQGIVEITGRTQEPRGVRIRYKLVQPSGDVSYRYRVALLPKRQLSQSEASLERLKVRLAEQETALKAGRGDAAAVHALMGKVAALDAAVKQFAAEWARFEAVVERHRKGEIRNPALIKAENLVNTAEAVASGSGPGRA